MRQMDSAGIWKYYWKKLKESDQINKVLRAQKGFTIALMDTIKYDKTFQDILVEENFNWVAGDPRTQVKRKVKIRFKKHENHVPARIRTTLTSNFPICMIYKKTHKQNCPPGLIQVQEYHRQQNSMYIFLRKIGIISRKNCHQKHSRLKFKNFKCTFV